ncbi:aldo/keto reductase, partial [Candidatus Shapirobacteria bacterium]|nr:aldo/keto reductase [Candidatus Shapirobacteria bacterium]
MFLKTISGKELSKIGIGTYGIGGLSHRFNESLTSLPDVKYVEALVTQLNLGMNFTEISVALAQGKSAKLLAEAIIKSNVKRDDIFITHSLWPKDLNIFEDILRDIEVAHKLFETNTFDSTLVTLSLLAKFGKKEVVSLLHKLIDNGKTRFVSLSNSNRATIKYFSEEFGDKFVAHEAHLSFEIRENEDEGIFEFCKELGVRNN